MRNEASKEQITIKYSVKVVPRQMKEGDLVLRRRTLTAGQNKLSPNYKGQFQVTGNMGAGTYKLEQLDGGCVRHTWNATTLRQY